MLRLPISARVLPLFAGILTVSLVGLLSNQAASAQGLGAYGFQPYGFYQPYGVRYRSSTATPPYFALNPPVYYGTRHFRPYGISPFAAPPQVSAPAGYEGQAGASGVRSGSYHGPTGNPFICQSCDNGASTDATQSVAKRNVTEASLTANRPFEPGKVKTNPFVQEETHFARR